MKRLLLTVYSNRNVLRQFYCRRLASGSTLQHRQRQTRRQRRQRQVATPCNESSLIGGAKPSDGSLSSFDDFMPLVAPTSQTDPQLPLPSKSSGSTLQQGLQRLDTAQKIVKDLIYCTTPLIRQLSCNELLFYLLFCWMCICRLLCPHLRLSVRTTRRRLLSTSRLRHIDVTARLTALLHVWWCFNHSVCVCLFVIKDYNDNHTALHV